MLIPSSAPKNAIPVARPPVNAFLPNSDGVTSVESPARSRRRSTTASSANIAAPPAIIR